MNAEKFKLIRDNFPLFYVVLILVGYSNRFHFYDYFNIEIKNYLTLHEILFSFLPLTTIIIFYALMLVLILSIFTYDETLKDIDKTNKSYLPKFNGKNKLIKALLWLSIFLLGLPVYLTDFSLNIPNWIVYLIITFSASLHFFIFVYNLNMKQVTSKNISKYTLILLSLFVLIWFNVNRIKAKDILNGNINKKIEILSKNDTIKSSKDFIYIGETANYFFFRNIKTNNNTIIKKDEYHIVNYK